MHVDLNNCSAQVAKQPCWKWNWPQMATCHKGGRLPSVVSASKTTTDRQAEKSQNALSSGYVTFVYCMYICCTCIKCIVLLFLNSSTSLMVNSVPLKELRHFCFFSKIKSFAILNWWWIICESFSLYLQTCWFIIK